WAIWPAILLFIVPPVLLRLNGSDTHVVLAMLDQIVYGVAVAALYRRRSRIFRHPLVCLFAGLSLIAAAWTDHIPGPPSAAPAFVWNMIILGCALLLPAALRLRTLPAWLSGAVVTASAQSYGLYLMHLTILVDVAQWLWNRHLAPTWVCAAIAIIAPFVLSYLSFRYLESPILRLRPEHRRRQAAAPAALRPAA
ncbi:MAG: Acyltransferase family, partial [Phenylobacterium sp.]|nr:Acyltransferase family [Phenylobacterium sp.]